MSKVYIIYAEAKSGRMCGQGNLKLGFGYSRAGLAKPIWICKSLF